MKKWIAGMLALMLLLGSALACAKPKTPAEAFAAFDKQFFIEYVSSDLTTLQQYVKNPASLGIDVNDVEITLGSFSKEEDDESVEWYQEMLDKLHEIDREALSERDQFAYDIIDRELTDSINSAKFYGCYEPLRAIVGLQADLPLEFWFFDVKTKWDAEAYLTLLADVPRFYADLLSYEQYRSSIGLFMTEDALDGVLKDLDDIIKVRDSIFLIKTYNDAIDLLTDITPEEAADFKARNLSLLTNEFYQAHVDLKAGLEALRPTCRETLGATISGNDLYKEYYVSNLISTISDTKTVDEVRDLLYAQMRKSAGEYMVAVQKLGYDPDIYGTTVSMGSIEENIAYLHEVLDPVLPEIPAVNVEYKNIPEELSEMMSPAAYLNPSYDDWQNNLIILNKPEEDETILSTLAHEGFNGHLYQFMYHRSMEGLSWSQQLLESTCYAEAWSQESERLLATYATGKQDPNLLMAIHAFNQYALMLEAYCSVLVNGYDNTLEDFTKYIESIGYDAELAKELYQFSVDNPYYYMNYAYSYARLQDLYNSAKQKLGSAFVEKDFFKAYLDCGPAPFDLIDARIDAWVAEQK